jgi:hypothetical protein
VNRRLRIAAGFSLLALLLIALAILHWGGYALVHSDPIPSHADGAIVLNAGAGASEEARISGAIQLLSKGIVAHILLSVPQRGFWGQSIPTVASDYLKKKYGEAVTAHIGFCETDADVNSTEQEAEALNRCADQERWQSIIVVTSNFHSRRAGMIWHRVNKRENRGRRIWMDGVDDPLFRPDGWWHSRLYAKTWFFEATKLIWDTVFREPSSEQENPQMEGPSASFYL